MTNLHLMYDKSSLIKKTNMEGSSWKDSLVQKKMIEKHLNMPEETDLKKEEDSRFGSLIEMLEKLFQKFTIVSGGGMSLDRLKDILRGKVKSIKPR